jgi:hypothetical protein
MRHHTFLLVIVGIFVGCGPGGQSGPRGSSSLLGVGATPPKLVSDGWLNGAAPSESELVGKVVVVNVWASW